MIMSLHTIFGDDAPPGTYSVFVDGTPSIKLGMTFYHTGLPDGSTIRGARLWLPSGHGLNGKTCTFMLHKDVRADNNNLDTAPVQSKVVSINTTAAGWLSADFDAMEVPPEELHRWMIAVQLSDVNKYIAATNFRPDPGNAYPAEDGEDWTISEFSVPTGPPFGPAYGPVRDRYFRIGSNTPGFPNDTTGGYGIDTIIEIPDEGPANQPPIANAGADQFVQVNSQVTLNGSASTDPDGSVAVWTWSQVSGPSVVLAGAGASRTFTPTETGNYVFALVVTDNGAASSVADAVVVYVLEEDESAPVGMEVNVMRRQTLQFIRENPTSITLRRSTRSPNGKGGYTETKVDVIPQTFRIIPQVKAGTASQNIDGEKVEPVFVMIGRWNADVNDNDTFVLGGRNYSVQHVRGQGLSTDYETWVEVIYRG